MLKYVEFFVIIFCVTLRCFFFDNCIYYARAVLLCLYNVACEHATKFYAETQARRVVDLIQKYTLLRPEVCHGAVTGLVWRRAGD